LCLNDTNPWNNKFCADLKRAHEAYKFVMWPPIIPRFFSITFWLFSSVQLFLIILKASLKGLKQATSSSYQTWLVCEGKMKRSSVISFVLIITSMLTWDPCPSNMIQRVSNFETCHLEHFLKVKQPCPKQVFVNLGFIVHPHYGVNSHFSM